MGQSVIKNPRKVFSQASGGDTSSLDSRITYLENNEWKITYFESVSAATGTITKPTGSTIQLDQLAGGVDAYVSTIVNGQPTGILPQTAGGVAVDVTSFDASGNYVLTGTPSAFPVAIIYIITIKAVNYQNLVEANILDLEDINAAPANGYTASRILITDANGYLVIANTATYPDLTELSYGKGVTSSIQTQLNNKTITVFKDSTTGTAITGTTANTIAFSTPINGDTFSVGDFMESFSRCIKTGDNSTGAHRLYINSSNSLSGATLIAMINTGATTDSSDLARIGIVKSSNVIEFPTATTSIVNRDNTSTGAVTSAAIDITILQYFIVAYQNASTLDSTAHSGAYMRKN